MVSCDALIVLGSIFQLCDFTGKNLIDIDC